MSPNCRRALYLLRTKEWVHGEELRDVAGSRYGARLDDLKREIGISWDKRKVRGYAVPWYRLIEKPEQLALFDAA